MMRFHVHLAVTDLAQSVDFYRELFGEAPTVLKHDYAKWMLNDPRVNFAISQRGRAIGVQHVGMQAESTAELTELSRRLERTGQRTLEEGLTTCCYARSEKRWIKDPQGLRWETFLTLSESDQYGDDSDDTDQAPARMACCAGHLGQDRSG
jgi:hypothetical protein